MSTPETPHQFLASLTTKELLDVLARSADNAVASGEFDADEMTPREYHSQELLEGYREIFGFVFHQLQILRYDGASAEYMTGYAAGALLTARAITIAAETREISDL